MLLTRSLSCRFNLTLQLVARPPVCCIADVHVCNACKLQKCPGDGEPGKAEFGLGKAWACRLQTGYKPAIQQTGGRPKSALRETWGVIKSGCPYRRSRYRRLSLTPPFMGSVFGVHASACSWGSVFGVHASACPVCRIATRP